MKIFYRLWAILTFVVVFGVIIAYARGYRFDLKQKSVKSTGILAITSSPKAAKVYLNGEMKGATDINFTLPPGQYQIEIKKDGFTSWSKKIILKGELVESVDALLFPTNASLSPLTNLGITKSIPIDRTDKILLFSQNYSEEKDGIYIFDPSKRSFSFLPPLKLVILKKNLPQTVDFTKTEVIFSPDLKQAIFDFSAVSYLLLLEEENSQPFEISQSKDVLITTWEEEKQKQILKILETFPKEIQKIATVSLEIRSFSPDEKKLLYLAKQPILIPQIINPPPIGINQTKEERSLKINGLYVYDKKEDKNYEIRTMKQKIIKSIIWYPDSKHLAYYEDKKISIIDYDGENIQTIYSGPLEDSFFTITADGQIVILASLNPEINKLPDLYLVGIR